MIFELLLVFDAISPSTIGLLGLLGVIYIVTLLILICLRDREKRTGPTRKEFVMMISICVVFLIPIIVINQFMVVGLIEPIDDMHSLDIASHPELLGELSAYFADTCYDLRNLFATLAKTRAYQRATVPVTGVCHQ